MDKVSVLTLQIAAPLSEYNRTNWCSSEGPKTPGTQGVDVVSEQKHLQVDSTGQGDHLEDNEAGEGAQGDITPVPVLRYNSTHEA